MALTRNSSPIKSTDPAMTTKTATSSPPPTTALKFDDNDTVKKESGAPSSPPSKRRKTDDDVEEQPKNNPAVAADNSLVVKTNDDGSQSNSSEAAAVVATTLTKSSASAASSGTVAAASKASSDNMETIDVANILGVKPGDRIEVKWNINDDDEDGDDPPLIAAAEGERLGLPKTEGEEDEADLGVESTVPLKSDQHAAIKTEDKDQDMINNGKNEGNNNTNSNSSSPAPPGMISVWWKATVQKATGAYHILDDTDNEAMQSGESPLKSALLQPQAPAAVSIATCTDKNQTYNCPKCTKKDMSKQGLYTHYGMVHGGKISRDFPNLLSVQQQQQQQQQLSNSNTLAMPKVRIPIYEIIYDPLPSLGFPEYSHEEVAFISNVTLLNLSSEEMMNFRREGDMSSPLVDDAGGFVAGMNVGIGGREGVSGEGLNDVSGGRLADLFGTEATVTAATTSVASKPPPSTSNNLNDVYKEFRTQDDIRTYMNELMQKSLISTGMNTRMASLPRSQQSVIAARINKALEGLLGKMMEEMGRVPEGRERVVTADVVRRCMEQMRPV